MKNKILFLAIAALTCMGMGVKDGQPPLRKAKIVLYIDDYICSESQWVYLWGFKSWVSGTEYTFFDSVFVPQNQHKIELEAQIPIGHKMTVFFSKHGPSDLEVAVEPDSCLILPVEESDGEDLNFFKKSAIQGELHNRFYDYYSDHFAWMDKVEAAAMQGLRDSSAKYQRERLDYLKHLISTVDIPCLASVSITSIMANFPQENIKEIGKGATERFPWYKGLQENCRLIAIPASSEEAKRASRRLYELKTQKKAYGKLSKDLGDKLAVSFKNKEGKDISTNELPTPYVLVDFWASWCKPCRKEVPEIKRVVEKYKDELTVYAVSLDRKRDAWQQAIEEDGTQGFVQLIGTFPNGNPVSTLLNLDIRTIPANFLLDKDRRIVAKDLRGEELMQTLDSLLEK